MRNIRIIKFKNSEPRCNSCKYYLNPVETSNQPARLILRDLVLKNSRNPYQLDTNLKNLIL
jgi:hypothetical protein